MCTGVECVGYEVIPLVCTGVESVEYEVIPLPSNVSPKISFLSWFRVCIIFWKAWSESPETLEGAGLLDDF